MPKIQYVPKRFNAKALETIGRANEIIAEYESAGFVLTLRQLYYQFVSRELIPNSQKSYKALGGTISDARLAGLVDWDAIEDRTRALRELPHWSSPGDVINSAAVGYHKDLWKGQDERVEVWIEKDALIGVLERVCNKWDVPHFSCRGYTSQSELWRAANRHKSYGCDVTVIHLGDDDPSGIDMTRDIEDRLTLFGSPLTIERIALNMDQVEKFKLPPNPAKVTDARFRQYEAEHGSESWELDALDPSKIEGMVQEAICKHLDRIKFDEQKDDQEQERELLMKASSRWDAVARALSK